MPKTVSIDNFGKAIEEVLEEYGDNVNLALKDEVLTTGKRAVRELKNTSQTKTGDYRKGWAYKKTEENATSLVVTVHNRTDYQLTHLLEHGHAMVLKGGRTPANGRTWVDAYPHIEKTQNSAEQYLDGRLKIIVGK